MLCLLYFCDSHAFICFTGYTLATIMPYWPLVPLSRICLYSYRLVFAQFGAVSALFGAALAQFSCIFTVLAVSWVWLEPKWQRLRTIHTTRKTRRMLLEPKWPHMIHMIHTMHTVTHIYTSSVMFFAQGWRRFYSAGVENDHGTSSLFSTAYSAGCQNAKSASTA